MPKRKFPEIVAARVTAEERRLVGLLAERKGVPISTMLRDIILPEIERRLGVVILHDEGERLFLRDLLATRADRGEYASLCDLINNA